MPHCIVEYSSNLEQQIDPKIILDSIQQGVLSSGLFDPTHIKTRAISYEHFQLGTDASDFVHVTIRLHRGRSSEQKQMLSKTVLNELKKLTLHSITMTVEVVDIDTDSYSKWEFL